MKNLDPQLVWAFSGVLSLLAVSSLLGLALKVAVEKPEAQATIRNLNARIGAWWVMSAIFGLTLVIGQIGSLVLFGIMSLLALREYVTLLPTRRADHRALFWSFFIFTPLQYFLIGIHWYGMFAILIPVYAFLYVPTRLAIAGDTESFLQRAATIQWGLMVCVYCLSYTPALLMLKIPGYGRSAGFAHHRAHGLCRRPDHVGHQARPRRERLRHADQGPRRNSRPHGFHVFCSPDLLSHRTRQQFRPSHAF